MAKSFVQSPLVSTRTTKTLLKVNAHKLGVACIELLVGEINNNKILGGALDGLQGFCGFSLSIATALDH